MGDLHSYKRNRVWKVFLEELSQANGKQVRNGTMYQEGGRVEFKPEFKVLQGAQKG